MFRTVSFGVSSLSQSQSSRFSGESHKEDKQPIQATRDLFTQSQEVILGSAESAEQIGWPNLKLYLQHFLKHGESPALSKEKTGMRLIGPQTFDQHVEHMVHLLHRSAKIPVHNKLDHNRLTLNEALAKNHPFLFSAGLKRLKQPEASLVLNQTDRYGLTSFHTAILTRHFPEALQLLKKGADPFITDKNETSALDLLAAQGEVHRLKIIVNKLDTEKSMLHAKTIQNLLQQAEQNQTSLKQFTEEYKSLSSEQKQTALLNLTNSPFLSAQESEKNLRVLALLNAKADIKAKDAEGNTVLHGAAINGHHTMIAILVPRGADMNATDQHGNTPLNGAVLRNPNNVVSSLLRANANVRLANHTGNTPLILAAYYSCSPVVEALLEEGANVNAANRFGETPLHMAAHSESGFHSSVQAILDNGGTIDAVDHAGYTPIDRALARGHDNLVQLLKNHKKTPLKQ